MKKVILVRHAKSSWDDPTLEDHDRPLNKRGRNAAPVIAGWIGERGHLPDLVLCSSAARTQETYRLMSSVLPDLPAPETEPGLYHAAPADLLARLSDLPDEVVRVMLIGHQPGLGGLARRLAGGTVRPRCAQAFSHFPTAAAAVLEIDIPRWSEIRFGAASFVDFAKPRDLMAT